jgi:hypothetical protein
MMRRPPGSRGASKRGVAAAAAAAIAWFLAASAAGAQPEPADLEAVSEPDSVPGRLLGEAGLAFVSAVPVGEFENFIDAGFGAGGFACVNFDADGWAGLRLSVGWVSYGSATTTRPLFEGDERILVDINTENSILTAVLGPQLTVARGRVRPYGEGGIGFSYFATRSSVSGTDNTSQAFASSTNFDDVTFAGRAGGGLLILVYERELPLFVDVGVHYLWNGRVQYMTEDSLVQRPDGSVYFLRSIESEANMTVFHLGIALGIR